MGPLRHELDKEDFKFGVDVQIDAGHFNLIGQTSRMAAVLAAGVRVVMVYAFAHRHEGA